MEWVSNDIQYLHGNGYLLGASGRHIVTLEHASGWSYGDNYVFVDTIDHAGSNDPVAAEAYGEAYGTLSLSRITGKKIGFGVVDDVGIEAGFNAGSEPSAAPFRAYLAGITFKFKVPQFDFLRVDVLAYKNERLDSTAMQVTPSWEVPFQVAHLRFRFRGFLDYVTAGGGGASPTVLTQPQLLWDVGALSGAENHLFVGMEYQYWHNKFGIAGVTESVPQAIAMWRF
jgi:nucleoside-specific outer membrane channel protein Tsx